MADDGHSPVSSIRFAGKGFFAPHNLSRHLHRFLETFGSDDQELGDPAIFFFRYGLGIVFNTIGMDISLQEKLAFILHPDFLALQV
jgi:hypothetical protein